MNEEDRVKELEKEIEELSFIRGVSDAFGSYRSLQKDSEIILFFLADDRHIHRYCELIEYFTERGWGRSTVERHLHNLIVRGILERTSLPGEYTIRHDLSRDMDTLVYYLIGDLYRLAKKSWKNKDYRY